MEMKIENTPHCSEYSYYKAEENIRENSDYNEFQDGHPSVIQEDTHNFIKTESVIPEEHHKSKRREDFEKSQFVQNGKNECDRHCKSLSIFKVDMDEINILQVGDSSMTQEDTLQNIKMEPLDAEIEIESDNISVKEKLNVTFICDKCYRNFEDEETIKGHRKECVSDKSNHSSNLETQTSSIPKKSFHIASESQAQLHKNKKSITCDICNFTCLSETELQRHKLSHEILPERFRCKFCTNIYSKLHDLKVHTITHRKDKDRKCTICNMNFYKMHLLQKHVTSQHKDPFACEICGVKCRVYSILVKHIRTHTGERPYKCEICGKTFAITATLWGHKRNMHSSRSYKCNLCDKSYGVAGAYRRHLKVHSVPTKKNFQCSYDGCDKKYRTENGHAQHLRAHENWGSYICHSCERSFSSKLALQRHMVCHMEEKPFECHTCNKKFTRREYLNKHFKSRDHKRCEMAKKEKIKIEDRQS